MDKDRYLVQESEIKNHFVCTDLENKIVVVWEIGKYNESQKVTTLEDFNPNNFMLLAKLMRQLSHYLVEFHPEKL